MIDNRELLYKECQTVINAMVDKINRLSFIDREEILSEANLIFCKCLENWQKEKGEFKRYLSTFLYHDLYRFCKKRKIEISELYADMSFIDNYTSHKDKVNYIIDQLSSDGKNIVDLIIDLSPNKKLYKTTIKNYIKKNYGWKNKRINIAFQEIEKAIL